jgi:hypothetical protein
MCNVFDIVRKWEWFTISGWYIWNSQRYYFSDCERVLSHGKVASLKIICVIFKWEELEAWQP